MKKYFWVAGLLSALLVGSSITTIPVYATQQTTEPTEAASYQLDDDGNWFKQGGLNEYAGVKAENREETEKLEEQLQHSNYILINTPDKEISEEAFQSFYAEDWWFNTYIKEGNEFYDTQYKVYVYKPSYDDFMEGKETGILQTYTRDEITYSTVVLSYAYWYSKDRAGTLDDQYGDNIPSWVENIGWLEIDSPADVLVTLHLMDEDTYFEFPVKANQPYLVRMKAGSYNVTNLNTYNIPSAEVALPYENAIQIAPDNTEKEPYVLNLERVLQKYRNDIPDIVIQDTTQVSSTEQEQSDTEGQTSDTAEIATPTTETEKPVKVATGSDMQTTKTEVTEIARYLKKWQWVLILILLLVIAFVILIIRQEKENKDK